jgi:CheY-like chemotaxis protein
MAKRILITDDALFMRVTLKNILMQNGYEVAGEASNGAEAVELYKQLADKRQPFMKIEERAFMYAPHRFAGPPLAR